MNTISQFIDWKTKGGHHIIIHKVKHILYQYLPENWRWWRVVYYMKVCRVAFRSTKYSIQFSPYLITWRLWITTYLAWSHFSHTLCAILFPLCNLLWISSTNVANHKCNATAVTRDGPYFSSLNTASFSSCVFISFSASSSSSSCIVHSSLRQLLF